MQLWNVGGENGRGGGGGLLTVGSGVGHTNLERTVPLTCRVPF